MDPFLVKNVCSRANMSLSLHMHDWSRFCRQRRVSGMKAEKPLKLRATHSAIAFILPRRNTSCIGFPKIFINASEVFPKIHR